MKDLSDYYMLYQKIPIFLQNTSLLICSLTDYFHNVDESCKGKEIVGGAYIRVTYLI